MKVAWLSNLQNRPAKPLGPTFGPAPDIEVGPDHRIVSPDTPLQEGLSLRGGPLARSPGHFFEIPFVTLVYHTVYNGRQPRQADHLVSTQMFLR